MFNINLDRIKKVKIGKGVGLGGVFNIIITLMTTIFGNTPEEIGVGISWIIAIWLVGLYFFSALAGSSNVDFDRVTELSGTILSIGLGTTTDNVEKILLVRDQLELYMDLFMPIFTQVRKIMSVKDMKKAWKEWRELIKTTMYKVVKGEVPLSIILWVFFYISYRVLFASNYFDIPLPYNIIISVGLTIALEISKGNLRGIGFMLKNVYQTIKPYIDSAQSKMDVGKTEKDVERDLRKIIINIRKLCFLYDKFARAIEKACNVPLSEFFGNKGGTTTVSGAS